MRLRPLARMGFQDRGVIGEDFLRAISGRQMQQKNRCVVHRPISAGRHARQRKELPVKDGFAFKPRVVTRLRPRDRIASSNWREAALHPLAPQPCGRGQMRVRAEQIAEFRRTDAGRFGERGALANSCGCARTRAVRPSNS